VRSEAFASAWALFDRASTAARELPTKWNDLVGTDLFSTSVFVDDDGVGRVDAFVDDYEVHRLDDLQETAHRFVSLLLASAREALLDAERCVSAAFRAPGGDHLPRFPLCSNISEFRSFIDTGALAGLRPDQIQLIEQFQTYYRPRAGDDSYMGFLHLVQHFHHLGHILDNANTPIVGFWAHSAQPQILTEPANIATDIEVHPDGVLIDSHCVATFRVPPNTRVRVNPGIALDPIFNAEPWPRDPDDTMDVRCRGLVLIVEELIQGLERSVGLRPRLHRGHFRLVPLPENNPLWARVDTSAAPGIETGLRTSDLGLASYRTGDEFIMLVQRPDGIYGRVVPQPEPLDNSIERGVAAEDASRGSAARWGLPDFVLEPEIVRRGAATREVGDGTIVCGTRGLAVQVKARTAATDNPDRERAWITKKIAEGARQASGPSGACSGHPLHTPMSAGGRSP
jgi:hypothetical protein